MAKETLNFEPARAHGGGHGSLTQVELVPSIAAGERVLDLKLSSGHRFRITAKAAHLLAVAMYGVSENHAEELPPVPVPQPGDLVQVSYRATMGELRPHHGGYIENCWKVSGTKKKPPAGHIFLYRSPRQELAIDLSLVQFHSRPEKR